MSSLARLGVTVRTGCVVTDVQPDSVTFRERWRARDGRRPHGGVGRGREGLAARRQAGRGGRGGAGHRRACEGARRFLAAGPSRTLRHRRPGGLRSDSRANAAGGRPARAAGRCVCRPPHPGAPSGPEAPCLPLQRPRKHGDGRPQRRDRRRPRVPILGLHGLRDVDVHPSALHRAVPQPGAGARPVAAELLHGRPLRPPDRGACRGRPVDGRGRATEEQRCNRGPEFSGPHGDRSALRHRNGMRKGA